MYIPKKCQNDWMKNTFRDKGAIMNKDFVLDFVAGGMFWQLINIESKLCTFEEINSFEGVSAAVSKTVVAPLERVKLLLQIQVNVCDG